VKTVLLLHAGIADSRMWRPQIEALEEAGYRVIAPDLRGFGANRLQAESFSHLEDVEVLLDGPSAVVGCSLGGRVALELAVHRPELVERLVVIAPGLTGWDWSDETRAGWAEEETAFDAGDLEASVEASVRMWVDGPNRSPEEVDPGLREAVTSMVLRSYEMQQGAWEEGADEREGLGEPVGGRLGEIDCPVLVLVGEEDIADMQAIAAHVAEAVPGARLERVADTAHLPSLERADEVTALLLAFLAER
jgi:pimeloyl-ACP methyl ester carboxylesterase